MERSEGTETEVTVLEVGDKLLLRWPLDGPEKSWRKMKVVSRKECKTIKHGSRFKYSLQHTDSGESELIETRLLHLEWKPRKKRELSLSQTDVERPLKRRLGRSIGRIPLEALRYILAPMVGASELPFRILCRRYGATLAYTPMMLSSRFGKEEAYRREEFQTCAEDRPLVAHFAANNPEEYLAAALCVQKSSDAIDLNLGCPQRVAHSGHFGSFLLDEEDRPLVLSLVRRLAESRELTVPVFVKIRLLSTLEDTIRLCRQLVDAGAAVIAIHARHRVSLVGRSGPTARDGPALLDQMREVRRALHSDHGIEHVPIIANGNIRTWDDVQANLALTNAEGVMSAEGILDNPALFHSGTAVNKLNLAAEYLALVKQYPTKLKSVIFHIRRMCRKELEQYQLLQECINANSAEDVSEIVERMRKYERDGDFVFDADKEKREKEAEALRKHQEGRRKEYEARMVRKAKRENKPLDFYLKQGSGIPSVEIVQSMKNMIVGGERDKAFSTWRQNHGQHCWAYHFEATGCPRDRKCAFLHCDATMQREASDDTGAVFG